MTAATSADVGVNLTSYKKPESVLVVVHTVAGEVLLVRRADHEEFWQSITGSLKEGESPRDAAVRELLEETGIEADERLRDWKLVQHYEILPQWRNRYAPGVTQNTEHMFSYELPEKVAITLNTREHVEYCWQDFSTAVAQVFSVSNRTAILKIAAE